MDYMDSDDRCSKKSFKLNHSLTHSLIFIALELEMISGIFCVED